MAYVFPFNLPNASIKASASFILKQLMMASHSQINVVEVTRVSPPAESATEFTLPLTFLDTFWFKFPPVERLFFYKFPESTRPLFTSVIFPKLKASLSAALFHYLPLAGNLIWPPSEAKPIFFYSSGDGVALTVAESTAEFDRLAGRGIKRAAELHHLVPKLVCSDERAEPISLQITLFPDRGFCLGVSAHHAALDGKSTTSFMKAWAYLCREEEAKKLPPELVPFLDRSVVKDPTRMDQLYAKQWVDYLSPDLDGTGRKSMTVMSLVIDLPPDMVRVTLELTKEDIELLRKKVSSEKRRRPSTFVITLAYMMTCMVRAKNGSGDRAIAFGFTADYRTRLDPPVPENYFGNCASSIYGKGAEAKQFMGEDGFEFAVELVSEAVERLESDPMADMDTKLSTLFGYLKNPNPGEPMQAFSVAGAPRFGVYGVDFGWGRPELVEIVSVDRSGAIALAESRGGGGGGVEVGLVMKKDEMENLVQSLL